MNSRADAPSIAAAADEPGRAAEADTARAESNARPMTNYVYWLKRSEHPAARAVRGAYRTLANFSAPAPRAFVRPIVAATLAIRGVAHWLLRVFLCEPYLKSRCAKHGSDVRTGIFFHFFSGHGDVTLGDRVRLDGKSSFIFASILPETPQLVLGDDSYVNHNATFIVARRIVIGKKVLIGPNVTIFDSPGHPLDPEKRAAGAPPSPDEIREVRIEDKAWICTGSCIFPGVTVGEGSVVAMGSIVTKDVPPRTLVGGAPARVIRSL